MTLSRQRNGPAAIWTRENQEEKSHINGHLQNNENSQINYWENIGVEVISPCSAISSVYLCTFWESTDFKN